jgi:hypothetical protein
MLGLLNAVVKPIIAFLTLRFIFVTGGLVLALIIGLILCILAWLFPARLQVDTLLAALLGGLVLGLSSAFLEALLGLNPPIVAEKYPEIRERIKDRQFYRSRMVPARMAAASLPVAGELEMEPADLPPPVPKTADALAQAETPADENNNDKTSLSSTATEPEA